MKLSEIAQILQSQLVGDDKVFTQISIDSRTLNAGDLFVAVAGENFDGHDFLTEVVEKNAVAIVTGSAIDLNIPHIIVPDTIKALGQIAAYYRQQLAIPTVAITGSCGKTTTKSMVANILSQCGKVHANKGSFNNHFGLPLTLFSAKLEHDYLVLELGANHPGEIAYLTAIAQPNVAVLTNAAACHLEGFGTIDGVANAKAEIFQGLTNDGTAVLNRDDKYYDFWLSVVKEKHVLSFGVHPDADVRAVDIISNQQGQCHFTLTAQQGNIIIKLPLLGQHNVVNALAAAAASLALGASLAAVQQGLEHVEATSKRLVTKRGLRGARIIDDSYNANPHSMRAAIQLLTQLPGEKIFVVGDMVELGPESERYHYELGEAAKAAGVDQLYAVGTMSQQAVVGFGQAALHFPDQAALVAHLSSVLTDNNTVLVKGSRSAAMENVVEALIEKTQKEGHE